MLSLFFCTFEITVYFDGHCTGSAFIETFEHGACQNTTGNIPSYTYSCTRRKHLQTEYASFGCEGAPINITNASINAFNTMDLALVFPSTLHVL